MGNLDSTPSPPHQYPLAIQLKLYQAFIFSIPILFSIILFLLFYLFYLKRRAAAVLSNSQRPVLPRTNADANFIMDLNSDLANELKNKLCRVIFDECMEARELLCCVCLGEFEVKEELVQVASCKHMFHLECIHHWLHNHSTCPLCRAPVHNNHPQPPLPPLLTNSILEEHSQSDHHQVAIPPAGLQNCTRSQGSSSSGESSTC